MCLIYKGKIYLSKHDFKNINTNKKTIFVDVLITEMC